MDTLSYELVAQIASYLSAGDALSLGATCRRVREACLARLDPERYLQTTFKNARYLLAAMTDYGCILSGSRALEYFVPGSIDDPDPATAGRGSDAATPSDWDFLVSCVTTSVYGMMDALHHCGVEWQHPLADVLDLANKPAGSSAIVRAESLFFCEESSIALDSLVPPSAAALYIFRQLKSYIFVNTDLSKKTWVVVTMKDPETAYCQFEHILVWDMASHGLNPHTGRPLPDGADEGRTGRYGFETYQEYGYMTQDASIFIINGYITPPGGLCQKVQLFQCHNAEKKGSTPLEYVLNTYYATHVQCFISGWAAGHFYYDLARQKLALTWPTASEKQRSALKVCVQKYRRRGFRFFHANLEDLAYNYRRCDEYDDNLYTYRHHESNPKFAEAVYTPENLFYATPSRATSDRQVAQMAREFTNTHIKPSPGGQEPQPPRSQPVLEPQPPRGTAPPLSTHRTGRLSQEGYDALQRHDQPISSSRLGDQGTLFICFTRFQNEMMDTIRSTRESKLAARGYRAHYQKLEKSLYKFRYMALTRPQAIEPMIPDLPRINSVNLLDESACMLPSLRGALSLATIHSVRDLGNRGAPPNSPIRRLDSSSKEWRYYQLINKATTSSCFGRGCHKNIAHMLPPQI
ncbi:hypothetical protein SBRCBS47491_008900 [Sporothrix bragantina]|uniref:F-box domain-containing protein n=1 Tax=Sporothrix bragantina TaxID=671064 RepID=A0ABP0CQX4_9PEZI